MMWNRAVRLQDAAAPPTYGDDKCLGDFNNDGAVTVLELMEVLAAYGMVTCSLRADLDGDCAVTVRDLLILLSHFGVCTAPDAERVSEYEISRLFLSGFRSELADPAIVEWQGPCLLALELEKGALSGWSGPLVYPDPFRKL